MITPMIDLNGCCTRCGDYARDCICPDPVDMTLTVGTSVSLTLNPDGSVTVEIDLSDYADVDSFIYDADGEEASDEERDALIDRLEAVLPTTLTYTVTKKEN
jgi:hypothetical protein